MHHSQLDLLPPEQAAMLIRRKRFWKRTMWFSLSLGISLLAWSIYIAFAIVLGQRGNIPPPIDREVFEYAAIIWLRCLELLWHGIFRFFLSGSFAIFLISLIRVLSLPKFPSSRKSS